MQKQFRDVDEAWAVLSKAGKDENTDQIWAAIKWLAPQGAAVKQRMTEVMNDKSKNDSMMPPGPKNAAKSCSWMLC